MNILPKPEAFVREALILIGGAVLATIILQQFPKLRAYIDTSKGKGNCNCGG
jgi:hypothetical protein